MSDAQFVAFYPDALLYLTKQGDIEALGVLVALAKHANRFGGCDPGDSTLGALCGCRRDAVPDVLERLQAADYIHIIETSVPYRDRPLRGYQINPLVLRLRPDCHSSAWADWQGFKSQTNPHNEKPTTVITFPSSDQQPDQIKNQSLKPASKPESEAPHQPASNNAEGVITDKDPSKGEGQGQEQKPDAPTEQAAGRTALESASNASAVPGSAPPPAPPPQWEPKSLQHYKRPLADSGDESMALDMVSLAGDMSRENARMLVDTYGWDWCAWVMSLFRKESYSVEHPARWIRSMLRKTTTEPRQRQG